MSADKLAEAQKAFLNCPAENYWPLIRALQEALAAHESGRALAALTAEQRRLGMYEAEKQEPVAWVRRFQIGEDDFDAETLVGQTHPNELGMDCLAHDDWEPLFASPQQEPDRLAKLPLPVQDACDIDYCSGSEMGYAEGWNDAIDAAKEAKP